MSEKLTCKMSDGTEWEVYSTGDTLSDGIAHYMLKPIKRGPKEEINLTKLTEVRTYEGLVGSGVDEAIRTLAKMAAMHKCIAKMEVNDTTLSAVPWMSEEGNIQYCKDHYWRCAKEPKREPRDGYTLQRRSNEHLCMSREEAEETLGSWSNAKDFEIVKVREVIE